MMRRFRMMTNNVGAQVHALTDQLFHRHTFSTFMLGQSCLDWIVILFSVYMDQGMYLSRLTLIGWPSHVVQ
jgi:hypothetical protein